MKSRERYLKSKYGITEQQYNDLLDKQDHACAWCGMKNETLQKNFNKSLVVDHSHVTGKVRGLLCVYCNRSLGMNTENPYSETTPLQWVKNAQTYINEHSMEDEFVLIKEGRAQYKEKGIGLDT